MNATDGVGQPIRVGSKVKFWVRSVEFRGTIKSFGEHLGERYIGERGGRDRKTANEYRATITRDDGVDVDIMSTISTHCLVF